MLNFNAFYRKNIFLTLLFAFYSIFSGQLHAQNCKVEIVQGFPDKGCAPHIVKLKAVNTDKTKTPVRWVWDFGDGQSNPNPLADSNVIHQFNYPSPDTAMGYKPCVTITFSDGTQCKACLQSKVTVWNLPKANFNLSSPATQCFSGNNFCFTDSSSASVNGVPIVKRFWDFGDGEIDSINKNPCHSYKISGVFTVRLIIRDANGCMNGIQKTALVNVWQAQPRFQFISYQKGCTPHTIKVKNLSLSPGSKYTWKLGNGTTVTTGGKDTFVNLLYDKMLPEDVAAGKDSSHFFITLTQVDSFYDAKTGTTTICSATWPDPSPDPNNLKWVSIYRNDPVFITGDSLKCSGNEFNFKINFLNNTKSGLYNYYDWDFGDGQTIMQNPLINRNHTYKNAGIYNVKVKAYTKYGCSTISQSFRVRVSGIKVHFSPSKISGNTFSFSNNTVIPAGNKINRFYWDFGDTTALDSVSWPNAQHTYKGAGPYTVSLKLIDDNGCTSVFDTTVSYLTNITEQIGTQQNLNVFINPNPFTECATIKYTLAEKAHVRIQLYDITGKLLANLADTKSQPGEYALNVDAQNLKINPGIYFIKIMVNNKISEKKIIRL